ncbi:MAG: helix-turn-helix domain-containing protein [Dehalococcoidales bacterium]|nr:helix-turn-helix domain-containing protein [Dehalococcoidales bacterium]
MSHSWLYDRQEQLDGYKAFARIAYILRRHVLPEDRDDIEMDIILKLKTVSDKRNGEITPASLWFVGRCLIADYWKRKYRERRRSARIFDSKYGEMASHSWEYIYHSPITDTEIDTSAVLNTLPERLRRIGELLVNGERLNTADKCYLSRQRAKLLQDYNYRVGDTEAKRIRRLRGQGLSRCKIAKALGRSRTTISKYLNKMALA